MLCMEAPSDANARPGTLAIASSLSLSLSLSYFPLLVEEPRNCFSGCGTVIFAGRPARPAGLNIPKFGFVALKPNFITLAGSELASELAPNRFGTSEPVRSWFEACSIHIA